MKNSELKTAAAYIRVSTDKQTELSPESQIKEIQNYAKQNGYIIPRDCKIQIGYRKIPTVVSCQRSSIHSSIFSFYTNKKSPHALKK